MFKKMMMLSCLLVISGCAKSNKNLKSKKQKSKNHELIQGGILDAVKQYTLIPDAPFGFVPMCIEKEICQNSENTHKVKIQYCKQRKDAFIDQAIVRAQLQQEMQSFGWQLCSSFLTDNEWVVWYKRPQNVWSSIVLKNDLLIMTVL